MTTTSFCVPRREVVPPVVRPYESGRQLAAQLLARPRRLPLAVACAAALFLTPRHASALTPESPEVKEVIAKGVRYLEGVTNTGYDNKNPGAKALVAMCVLKHYKDVANSEDAGRDHPRVVEAVEAIRDGLRSGLAKQQMIYNTGVCLLFLLELDRVAYRPEMEQLLALQLTNQKANGSFDYVDIAAYNGDISVSQYGVLGFWACQMAQLPVPIESWDRVANWLLRVQDPGGGYGYKATDPGNFSRVLQPEVRLSLSAAGLGSVCICAATVLGPPEDKEKETGPPQLKRVESSVRVALPRSKNISMERVNDVLALGKGYFAKNYTSDYKMDPIVHIHYYMYAMERYKSFLAELQPNEKNDNQWYDDGYAMLAKTQLSEGCWHSPGNQVIDTCFAVLFLMRSTKKIIERAKTFGGGLLVGGRGLPENSADILIAPGGIRTKPLKGPAMELLQKLAPDDPHMEEVLSGLEGQSLVQEGDRMNDVQKRLHHMMEQAKTPESKAAALKLIGRTRNLDEVPILIEALKDPDATVFLAANDALRFLARKFGDAGYYGGTDEKGRKHAREKWIAWYREVRPDAEFDVD
ncbi:MAG TPA: hypothetical protein VG826_30710 [Pirellulales bacterium]|nr:hypothetical protein [Pirellulales bacterium]